MPALTLQLASASLGTDLVVEASGLEPPMVLRLAVVRELGHRPGAPREDPFALELIGPPAPVLPQRTYRLVHAGLGALDIFLVPIGFDETGGVRYEAVFN